MLNREDPAYHVALGAALWRLTRHEEACEAFQEALRIASEDAPAWNGLGVTLLSLGRPREAAAALERAAAGDGAPEARANLAVALWRLDRTDEALETFREAIRRNPDAVILHRNHGRALTALGRHDGALASFREAARLRPSDWETHLDLGDALFALGRVAEAEAAYDEATHLDPRALASRPSSRDARQAILVGRVRAEVAGGRRVADGASRLGWAGVLGLGHGLAHLLRNVATLGGRLGSVTGLILVGALVYAGWVLGPPYVRYYLLKDDVTSAARAPVDDDGHVRERLMLAVRERGLEAFVPEDCFQIHTRPRWRVIACDYEEPVRILPQLGWPIRFRIRVEEPFIVVQEDPGY